MPKFSLSDFDAKLDIVAKNEQEASIAVVALEKLFRQIDAATIIEMQKVIERKNVVGMMTLANKIISSKN